MANWVSASPAIRHLASVATTGDRRAHNLPDWAVIGIPFEANQSQIRTSHPSTHIKKELEQNLIRLLDQDMFKKLLSCVEARSEFRAWLVRNEPGELGTRKLDRWTDEQRANELKKLLRDQCESLFGKLSPKRFFFLISVVNSYALHRLVADILCLLFS